MNDGWVGESKDYLPPRHLNILGHMHNTFNRLRYSNYHTPSTGEFRKSILAGNFLGNVSRSSENSSFQGSKMMSAPHLAITPIRAASKPIITLALGFDASGRSHFCFCTSSQEIRVESVLSLPDYSIDLGPPAGKVV